MGSFDGRSTMGNNICQRLRSGELILMAKTRTPFVFDTVLEEVYISVLRNFDIEKLVIDVARDEAS